MGRLPEIEVLTLLAVGRIGESAYGVAILDEIRASTGREASVAAVYAALERLDQQGLVRASLSDPLPERGGRSRKQYRLTAAGRTRLQRERATAMRMWRLKPAEDDPRSW